MDTVDACALFCPNGCAPRELTADELGGEWKDGTVCDRCGNMWVTPLKPISFIMLTISVDGLEPDYNTCTSSTMAKSSAS